MIAAADGEKIECDFKDNPEGWEDAEDLAWDWNLFTYRIKPTPPAPCVPEWEYETEGFQYMAHIVSHCKNEGWEIVYIRTISGDGCGNNMEVLFRRVKEKK